MTRKILQRGLGQMRSQDQYDRVGQRNFTDHASMGLEKMQQDSDDSLSPQVFLHLNQYTLGETNELNS